MHLIEAAIVEEMANANKVESLGVPTGAAIRLAVARIAEVLGIDAYDIWDLEKRSCCEIVRLNGDFAIPDWDLL